jgi:hypothetical protein
MPRSGSIPTAAIGKACSHIRRHEYDGHPRFDLAIQAARPKNKTPGKLIRGFLPVISETVRWLLNGVSVSRAIVSLHHAPPAFKDRPTVLYGLCGSRVATLKRTFCDWHLPFPCLPKCLPGEMLGLHRHRSPTNSQISKMTTITIPIWSMVFVAAS